jgi:hypothetical protein
LLFGGKRELSRRADAKVAAFCAVKEAAEDRRRVELWPASERLAMNTGKSVDFKFMVADG